MIASRIVAVCLLVAAAGCAGKPVLQPRDAVVPPGVDFSGEWQLRDGPGSETPPGAGGGELVRVFLESGKALKVTQTEHGIFISFDRAVVEEYRFGEHREVSVGEIVADRVSGWEGTSYVVETLDDDGVKLVESFRLAESGAALRRDIVIERRDKRLYEQVQVFDRR